MARPAGSPNKDKPFRDALRMVVAESENNPRKLRKLAERLFDEALDGDVSAIKEIADRLDGRVAQAITGDDELDPIRVIQEIRRTLVNPRDTDSEGVSSAT